MNPQMLTISHQVGLLLQTIFSLAAAFTPYVILTICIIGLLILACVPGWMREAKLLDEALDFGAASADTEKRPLIKDPNIDGSDSMTKGGGVTSRRPLRQQISTPVNPEHTETKCVSAGSGAGASRVGKPAGGECSPQIKNPLRQQRVKETQIE